MDYIVTSYSVKIHRRVLNRPRRQGSKAPRVNKFLVCVFRTKRNIRFSRACNQDKQGYYFASLASPMRNYPGRDFSMITKRKADGEAHGAPRPIESNAAHNAKIIKGSSTLRNLSVVYPTKTNNRREYDTDTSDSDDSEVDKIAIVRWRIRKC